MRDRQLETVSQVGPAAEALHDLAHVGVQRRLDVDELCRRLAAHVAVADQITEQSRLLGRYWLVVAEPLELPRARDAVSGCQLTGRAPAVVSHDLVVRGHPDLRTAIDTETDDILLTLVEP